MDGASWGDGNVAARCYAEGDDTSKVDEFTRTVPAINYTVNHIKMESYIQFVAYNASNVWNEVLYHGKES